MWLNHFFVMCNLKYLQTDFALNSIIISVLTIANIQPGFIPIKFRFLMFYFYSLTITKISTKFLYPKLYFFIFTPHFLEITFRKPKNKVFEKEFCSLYFIFSRLDKNFKLHICIYFNRTWTASFFMFISINLCNWQYFVMIIKLHNQCWSFIWWFSSSSFAMATLTILL